MSNNPTTRPKRIIIQHNSLGTTLPSVHHQNVDYSSSGLSGTSEDDIFFDSESYLSGDAGIDRNSTVLRGGRKMSKAAQPQQTTGLATTDNIPISSNIADDVIEVQSNSFPPANIINLNNVEKKKKKRKNLQNLQDQAMKKYFKELKESTGFYGGDINTEEDYKNLFVIPHEAIWTTEHFRNVIEPALREYEDQTYIHVTGQKPQKLMTSHERYHKLVEKQAKEALNRQYDVDFISLLEDIIVPFINQRKIKDEEEEAEKSQQTELVDRLKGNFMVLMLSDGHRRFLTHAICQFYALKSFSTDFDGQRVTIISKRRHLVESDDYPTFSSKESLLSSYLSQFKQEKPSYMLDNDLFKHEGNEIQVLDKKSFVKHYRKKKKKQQQE